MMVQLLIVLALLVGDAAAGLASGLARGLALTAATLQGAFAEVLGFQSLNFHEIVLRVLEYSKYSTVHRARQEFCQKKRENMVSLRN